VSDAAKNINKELDQVFRKNWGHLVAALTRILGTGRLDQAEALVQEAFVAALNSWAFSGVPENPVAWLITTAKNKALDQIKHDKIHNKKSEDIRKELEAWAEPKDQTANTSLRSEVGDDLLRMMYVCCFPELSPEVQVALILKNLCGLSLKEIARGFLQKDKTIEQRLTRARVLLREKNPAFEIPSVDDIKSRTATVFDALYLLFNEGYAATEGEIVIRKDLCSDAINLLDLILIHPNATSPEGHALQALFCLQASRFDARFNEDGDLVIMEDQKRETWDMDLVRKGLWHLNQAMTAKTLSVFHIEAGIAAEYATAPSYSATNWQQIINYYDLLFHLKQNPVVALNHAVALAQHEFYDKKVTNNGLAALYELELKEELKNYHLLYAAIATLELRRNDYLKAQVYFEKALLYVKTEPEKIFLKKRLKEVGKFF
jgi:RNA polymerase sigma factor (sigma-70 family)